MQREKDGCGEWCGLHVLHWASLHQKHRSLHVHEAAVVSTSLPSRPCLPATRKELHGSSCQSDMQPAMNYPVEDIVSKFAIPRELLCLLNLFFGPFWVVGHVLRKLSGLRGQTYQCISCCRACLRTTRPAHKNWPFVECQQTRLTRIPRDEADAERRRMTRRTNLWNCRKSNLCFPGRGRAELQQNGRACYGLVERCPSMLPSTSISSNISSSQRRIQLQGLRVVRKCHCTGHLQPVLRHFSIGSENPDQ